MLAQIGLGMGRSARFALITALAVVPLSRVGELEARMERIDLRIAGVQGVCSRLERQLGEVVELLRELHGEASAERG